MYASCGDESVALDEDGVSKEIIEKEIEIAKEQLRAEEARGYA